MDKKNIYRLILLISTIVIGIVWTQEKDSSSIKLESKYIRTTEEILYEKNNRDGKKISFDKQDNIIIDFKK